MFSVSVCMLVCLLGCLLFNQVFQRKKSGYYIGVSAGCWTSRHTQFLLCATSTFLKGFWPNFHRSFVIKCPDTYGCWCFVIRTFLAELWPCVTSVENLVSSHYGVSCFVVSSKSIFSFISWVFHAFSTIQKSLVK